MTNVHESGTRCRGCNRLIVACWVDDQGQVPCNHPLLDGHEPLVGLMHKSLGWFRRRYRARQHLLDLMTEPGECLPRYLKR